MELIGDPDAPSFSFVPVADNVALSPKGSRLPNELRPPSALVDAISGFLPQGARVPMLRLLASVSTTRTVIVEHAYFDMDFRSEYSLVYAGRFATTELAHAIRLHFFDRELTYEQFTTADEVELENAYRGYAVVRPIGQGQVGRALIRPPATYPGVTAEQFGRRVRTVVTEDIQIAGRSFRSRGVPFMQQDGHLLNCAHVVSWMSHYTSVLRGIVPRRPSASFFAAGLGGGAQRSYPSSGLTAENIVSALTRFDLSPDVFEVKKLRREAPTGTTLHRRLDADSYSEDQWWWHNLTSAFCRYLNSGFPITIALANHAILVVGYLRRKHIDGDPSCVTYSSTGPATFRPISAIEAEARDIFGDFMDSGDTVSALIVQDDQEGPYHLLSVADLLSMAPTAIVPLPHSLWLTGEKAESHGVQLFNRHLKRLAEMSEDEFKAETNLSTESVPFIREALQIAFGLWGDRQWAVRSYATTATSFKSRYLTRSDDLDAANFVGALRMPKYVWVVEFVDRGKRGVGDPVVGQVVLDASVPQVFETDWLLMQLPTVMIASDPLWNGRTLHTSIRPDYIESGRWRSDDRLGAGAFTSIAKNAVPVESLIGF